MNDFFVDKKGLPHKMYDSPYIFFSKPGIMMDIKRMVSKI